GPGHSRRPRSAPVRAVHAWQVGRPSRPGAGPVHREADRNRPRGKSPRRIERPERDPLHLEPAPRGLRDCLLTSPGHPKRSVTYGQLTRGKKIQRQLTLKPGLKARAQLRVIGKPHHRREGRDKVTGRAQYAADIRLPGMLYARILRPPAHGAKRQSLDLSAA